MNPNIDSKPRYYETCAGLYQVSVMGDVAGGLMLDQ